MAPSATTPSPKDFVIHVAIGGLTTFIVSWLDIRPLGILFVGALVVWLYSVYCPCSFTLENVKPIRDKLQGNLATFSKLRREKPAIFCLIVSVTLFLLMIMGHILSGTWLVIGGLSVVGLISSRHSIKVVRNASPKANADSPATTSSGPSVWSATIAAAPLVAGAAAANSEADDEFLPEVNESAMQVLNLAGDDAILLSAKTPGSGDTGGDDEDGDSVPLEMLMPEEAVPDVDRACLTDDDNLSDDELSLQQKQPRGAIKVTEKQRAALLDLNTSDEEDSLSRGLNFDDYNVVDASQPLVASYHSHKGAGTSGGRREELRGITDFVSNIIPWNKMGQLVAGASEQMTRSDPSGAGLSKKQRGRAEKSQNDSLLDTSSDESEFEMLNSDELKNYGT